MNTMIKSSKILAVLSACATLGPSHASLLVYEDFEGSNYISGANIVGVAAQGSGLTGNWLAAGASPSNPTTAWTTQSASPMSYAGGNVSISGGSQYALANVSGLTGSVAAWNVQLTDGLVPTVGSTYYMSFLFRLTGTAAITGQQYSLHLSSANETADVARAGVRNNPLEFGLNTSASGSPVVGDTYFGVLKLLADSGASGWDSADFYINPTSTTVEGTPTVSFNLGVADATINYLGVRVQNASSLASFSVDEIRIGTSWNSVAVPEPSSMALVGAAVAGFAGIAFLRRLRRSAAVSRVPLSGKIKGTSTCLLAVFLLGGFAAKAELTAQYTFEDRNGNDSSGSPNTYNLSVAGSSGAEPTYITESGNTFVRFSGASDSSATHLATGAKALDDNGDDGARTPYLFSLWFRTGNWNQGKAMGIISTSDQTELVRGWQLDSNFGVGRILFNADGGTWNLAREWSNQPSDNKWHHLVLRKIDGSNWKLYLDKVEVANGTAENIGHVDEIRLGIIRKWGGGLEMDVDLVQYWTGLNSPDIESLYEEGLNHIQKGSGSAS